MIETDITAPALRRDNVRQFLLRSSMRQRAGSPDDFDGTVLLLASDAGRYITGQTIRVDGAWTTR